MFIAVIGLGTFGAKTAGRLFEKGAEVLAIDSNPELVEKIKDKVTHAVCIDVTQEKAMRAVNITDVDTAVVAIGDNVQMSILAVAMLRKLGVGRILARATSQLHQHVLKEIGASEIVKVEEEMGDIIASKIAAPFVLQRYNFTSGYSIVEIKLGKSFQGKTLVESQIRQNYGLNIVALQKRVPIITEDGKAGFKMVINDSPLPMDVIEEDDIVVLVGNDKNFDQLFHDIEDK